MCGNVDIIPGDKIIDAVQAASELQPQIDLPLRHQFSPGIYIRTLFMPAGTLVVSHVHRTCHPFAIMKGRLNVYDADNGVREMTGGTIGISKAYERRFAYVLEDAIWTTFHANVNDEKDIDKIEAELIMPHNFDRQEALGILHKFLKKD